LLALAGGLRALGGVVPRWREVSLL
jgi:hypothetical protein